MRNVYCATYWYRRNTNIITYRYFKLCCEVVILNFRHKFSIYVAVKPIINMVKNNNFHNNLQDVENIPGQKTTWAMITINGRYIPIGWEKVSSNCLQLAHSRTKSETILREFFRTTWHLIITSTACLQHIILFVQRKRNFINGMSIILTRMHKTNDEEH